jgi:hypothetical protein
MVVPGGDICSICSTSIAGKPFFCSECATIGFVADPICSLACLDQAKHLHSLLHRARPHPPPGLSPAYRPYCGRCLVSTTNYPVGDIVVRESPLLSGTWRQCNVSFLGLTSAERDRVLSFSAADDDEICDDAARIGHRRIPAEEVAPHTADVIQILHNNSIDGPDSTCALYEYSSLIAHSCRPNVDGAMDGDIWVMRALLPIQIGDILGWNYNVSIRALMEGTERRRAELLDLRGFLCGCSACSEPDYLRSFRCRQCRDGLALLNGACSACGAVVDDDAERHEMSLFLELNSGEADWVELAQRAWTVLGPWHGVTGRATLKAANCTVGEDKVLLLARMKEYMSSPTMIDAALVHEHIRQCLQLEL